MHVITSEIRSGQVILVSDQEAEFLHGGLSEGSQELRVGLAALELNQGGHDVAHQILVRGE